MATTSPFRVLLAAAACLVVLSGCGDTDAEPTAGQATDTSPDTPTDSPTDDPGATESTAPTLPDLPSCEEAWGGARLDARYRGCLEGDVVVEPQVFSCSQGGRLAIYDTSYALLGRKINRTEGPLEQDPDYRSAIRACTA